ncbi:MULTISPECIES: radical SAM protein [Pyrococcus]|nr:radical SAM protein [Pyrococcus furiosus]AFN04579.1 arylsulfatase [Pyrococcus furiosus COM1]
MKYKPSRYNLFFKIDNNKWLLYNSLSESVIEVDDETKHLIENIDKLHDLKIPKTMLNLFLETKVILPKNINELNIVRARRKFSFLNEIGNVITFTLIMTYRCNLACVYCYEGDLKRRSRYLTKKDIDIIFDKFLSKLLKIRQYPTTLNVNLYGGEPLLNWEGCKCVFKKLDSLKKRGLIKNYVLAMVTNGTLLDDEK